MSTDIIPALSVGVFTATPTGLVVADGPAPEFEIWFSYGEALRKIKGALKFVLGDWLNFGEKAYGEKYSQAVDETDWTYGTLANIAYVCSSIEFSRRHENLSFEHHYEIAKFDPDLQDYWLDKAESEKWTREELRKHRDIATKGFAIERYIACPGCGHEFPLKGAKYILVEVTA